LDVAAGGNGCPGSRFPVIEEAIPRKKQMMTMTMRSSKGDVRIHFDLAKYQE